MVDEEGMMPCSRASLDVSRAEINGSRARVVRQIRSTFGGRRQPSFMCICFQFSAGESLLQGW